MFGTIENYSGVLRRVFWSTFLVALVDAALLYILNRNYLEPPVGTILETVGIASDLEVQLAVFSVKVTQGAYLAAAALVSFLVAFVFRIARVHDKASDLFQIRQKFDLHEILLPLAGECGINVGVEAKQVLSQKREDLMYRIFYKYASSTNPKIDAHLVHMALDAWSYYWMGIETIVIVLLFSVAWLAAGNAGGLAISFGVALLLSYVEIWLYRFLAERAHREVTAMVADDSAKQDIRGGFEDALRG